MPVLSRVWLVPLAFLLVGCPGSAAEEDRPAEIVVAAASDLLYAFREIGARFEEETGTRAVFNFGSSGQLAQQIEYGAPVDVFAAADMRYVEELAAAGRLVPGSPALYARGYLTLWTRPGAAHVPERVEDLIRPEFRRIAIANPQHAPYGRAAREALQAAGSWEQIQPRLVYGENIRQTLQFAESGNVEVAIVALALSIATEGQWVRVPEHLHSPIDQGIGVVRTTRREAAALRFVELVTGAEGQAILARYGFGIPPETDPR